jgi:hypothetical protein
MTDYKGILLGVFLGVVIAFLWMPKKVLIVTSDRDASGRDLDAAQ